MRCRAPKCEQRSGQAPTTYTYDAAGRLLKRIAPDQTLTYSYDPVTETFTYTPEGKLASHTRIIDGNTFSTTYEYDQVQRLISKTLPDGQQHRYHYYTQGPNTGKLRAITRERLFGLRQEVIVGEIDHDKSDGKTRLTHANGITTEYSFNTKGELTGITNSGGAQSGSDFTLQYEYDQNGQITGIDTGTAKGQYAYDRRGRLVSAETAMGTYRYQYDAVGNRTGKTYQPTSGDLIEQTYAYPEPGGGNRLLAVTPAETSGNANASAEAPVFDYNDAGSPTQAGAFEYEYNSDQRPVKVWKADVSIKNKTLTAEANEAGQITAYYVYLSGHRPVAQLASGKTFAIHTDNVCTPRVMTNADGQRVWEAEFSPFGEATVSLETEPLNLRLPGQYADTETGTYYNYFRDYDPGLGRYKTNDPIGLLGGLNSHAYVTGDPLGMIDPLGLIGDSDAAGGGWGNTPAPGGDIAALCRQGDRLGSLLNNLATAIGESALTGALGKISRAFGKLGDWTGGLIDSAGNVIRGATDYIERMGCQHLGQNPQHPSARN